MSQFESLFEQQEFVNSFQTNPLSNFSATKYRHLNRYGDVIPYSFNAVHLAESNRYINASFIHSKLPEYHFLATQGPLPETIGDFWEMVWQESVSHVVMLTSTAFASPSYQRRVCEVYWPTSPCKAITVANGYPWQLEIALLEETQIIKNILIERKLRIHSSKQKSFRNVVQLQFLGWPDHGVPDDFEHFSQLLRITEAHSGLAVVHCSAGIGRTGCFGAIAALAKATEPINSISDLVTKVHEIINSFRRQRLNMVQTRSQLRFVITFLSNYFGLSDRFKTEA